MTPLLAQRPRVDRAFERLYRRHVADVYHYALAVLRNPADAEDITQTTFLNAYTAYRRGERPAAPRNWLIAIAHNVCRQRFRQSARRPQEVALDEDVGETLVADDAPTAQDIRKALGHLAFNQRAALVMRELEGRSYGEIAEILGLSVSAVETLIFRARRALREQLEGSLTCQQAEVATSRQLDGRLPRTERGLLRAHLRECAECSRHARSQRAHRAALRSIGAIPLPASLASFFGGGTAVGTGFALKVATVVAVGAVVGGAGYEGVKRLPTLQSHARAAGAESSDSAEAPAASAQDAALASAHGVAADVEARPQGVLGRQVPSARPDRPKRDRGREAPALAASEEHGHSAAAPAHGKARPKPHRETASTSAQGRRRRPPGHASGRAHEKPKPKPAAAGQPEQPKPEPPGQEKKSQSALPVEPPQLPPPPALPDPLKPKK